MVTMLLALPHLHLRWIIPISRWTLVSGVVLVALSLWGWRRVAASLSWRQRPTLLTLLSLAGALALTLSPRDWDRNHRSLQQCLPHSWESFADAAMRVGGSLESVLNIGMLMPLGFGLVLASRRMVWPALLMVLLPAAIELTQVIVRGRQCSPEDWVANSLGGLIGVAVAVPINWWLCRDEAAGKSQRAALTSS